MNKKQNGLQPINDIGQSDFNLDELEASLDADLENSLTDLELLKEDREKIGNPTALSETVMNVVWEQFVNQVGAVAGEEFIRENRGLTLDLRDSAHIQTTENFEQGKIATHNSSIDYNERYDNWQSKLAHDENGNVITYTDRSGQPKARLAGPHVLNLLTTVVLRVPLIKAPIWIIQSLLVKLFEIRRQMRIYLKMSKYDLLIATRILMK